MKKHFTENQKSKATPTPKPLYDSNAPYNKVTIRGQYFFCYLTHLVTIKRVYYSKITRKTTASTA